MDAIASLIGREIPDAARSSAQHAASTPQTRFEKGARAKAEEFESVFLSMFLEQMWSGIETDGPFGGGHAEKVYRSMQTQQYARSISDAGGIGIADQVYSEILKAQEANLQ